MGGRPKSGTRVQNATDIERFCTLVASGEALNSAARLAEREEPPPGQDPKIYYQRGSALMKRPEVVERIATLKAELEAEAQRRYAYGQVEVIRDLIDIKKRCMQAEPVTDGDGEPTGEWTFNAKGAIAAIELVGKHLGMFGTTNKHLHLHAGLQDLTDEQLIARARAAAAGYAANAGAEGGADRADEGPRSIEPSTRH